MPEGFALLRVTPGLAGLGDALVVEYVNPVGRGEAAAAHHGDLPDGGDADLVARMGGPDGAFARACIRAAETGEAQSFEHVDCVATPSDGGAGAAAAGGPAASLRVVEGRAWPAGDGGVVAATWRDVTGRSRDDWELREGGRFAARVVETVPHVVTVFDRADRRHVYVGGQVQAILGRPASAVRAWDEELLRAQVHPADLPAVAAMYAAFDRTADGQVLECEYRCRHADGSWRWLRCRATVFARSPDGSARQVLSVAEDVTDRRAAREALRESESRFRAFFESAAAGTAQADAATGRFVRVNDRFCQLTGYPADELLGMHFLEITHPDDRDASRDGTIRLLAGDAEELVVEKRYVRKDGRVVWVQAGVTLARDADGRALHTIAVVHDVTDRRTAEDALRASLARTRDVLESITDAFFSLDRDWRFMYVNREAERIFATLRSDVIGRTIWEAFPSIVGTRFSREYERAVVTREPSHFEEYFAPLDGWFEIHAYPSASGLSVYFRDVTARKRDEQRLREAEALYEAMLAHYPNGAVLVFGHDLRYRLAGGTGLAGVGLSRADYEGRTPREALGPDLGAQLEPIYRRALAGEATEFEGEAYGYAYWAHVVPIRDADGKVLAGLVVSHDITARKAAEVALWTINEQLEARVRERTEALVRYQGQLRSLAGELARAGLRERKRVAAELHDNLAQLLAVCQVRLSTLLADLPPDGPAARTAGGLQAGLTRAAEYARTLISDLTPAGLQVLDLGAAVEWLAGKMAEHGLAVRVRDDGLDKPLDEEVLVTVFESVRELLFNVAKHGGTTRAAVHVRRVRRAGGGSGGGGAAGGADEVRVRVIDAGRGFDPATAPAAPGPAGGFGLFSIRERLDLLGGRIAVRSVLGRGTVATVSVSVRQRETP